MPDYHRVDSIVDPAELPSGPVQPGRSLAASPLVFGALAGLTGGCLRGGAGMARPSA